MSQPVVTATAGFTTNHLTNPGNNSISGAFNSFIDDLDQFILKDSNNNDLILNNFNSDDNSFKNFLSTSPSNSCSSLLDNNLLNSNEFDLFKFDKVNGNNSNTFSSNGIFDIYQYGDSMMPYNTCNNMLNANQNQNSTNSQTCDEETESDEDHPMVQNLLQDQELDTETFTLDDNEHMINDFGMISMANQNVGNFNNNDALVAIRDMACQDKKLQSRKHKNSTSSTASVSMSSTIKKVAIELQNSTANLVCQSFMESTVPAQNTCQTSMDNNYNNNTPNFESNLDFPSDTGLDDLYGLEDWEQMLDEDCISRLTTDFTNNYIQPNDTGSSLKLPITPLTNPTITTLQNANKPTVTTIQTSKGVAQTSRLVPHISTLSNQGSNQKTNQPLVLVLSSAGSSTSSSNASPTHIFNENRLKHTSSPSLTPIAATSPMNNHFKKVSTTRIAPTKIVTTTKPSTNPTNVVKKLNSVILSDGNDISEAIKSGMNSFEKNGTVKLENGGRMTNGPSITNTTSKTITTRQVPFTLSTNSLSQSNIKSYRLNTNGVATHNLGSSGSAHNSSISSSTVSSPNLSPTSSTTSSSLIDYCEIIDCVNPDQIFPYRLPLLRFVKTEMDSNSKMDDSCNYYPTQVYEDDEEEEEIDVVSVHNNTNTNATSTHLNLSHHNYFHTPSTSINGTTTQTTKTTKNTKKLAKNNSNNDSSHSDQSGSSSKSSNGPKQTSGRNKSATAMNKKTNSTSKQSAAAPAAANTVNKGDSNITQLNSIRILTTTNANATNNIRQLNTTSISKTTPQTSAIKMANSSSSSSLILNKEISSSSLNTTTKYITMTPSKLQSGINIKCQAITPTISSNKPKIVSATNGSLINFSSNSLGGSTKPLLNTTNLKFNTFNSSTGQQTNSYVTTLKIPTSLNKTSKKLPEKVKTGSTGTNSSAMLTEDDEFYYEDEEFGRGLSSVADVNKPKPMSFKLTGDSSISLNGPTNNVQNQQFNSVKMSDETDLDLDFMHDDLDDDDDDIDEDDEDDDEDDECSSSSNSSSPSPLTSSNSSGYSTPTKSSKLKAEFNDPNADNFDISNLNEKLSKKPKKMSSSMSLTNTAFGQSSKRNSRLSSMGYSSDNPAEKRAFHILSERQRRNDLKKLFETLRTNIPNLCDKQKASKLTILKAAVDHLCEVSNKKEKLSSVYEKEKARHAQLLQHLKSLQQQQHTFGYQPVQGTGQSTLAVH